jgi:hypothetical protein
MSRRVVSGRSPVELLVLFALVVIGLQVAYLVIRPYLPLLIVAVVVVLVVKLALLARRHW